MDIAQIVLKALFSLPEYQAARRVGVYLSMPSGEISTGSIVHDALQSSKAVYVPFLRRTYTGPRGSSTAIMDMVSLHSLGDYQSLQPDRLGIPSLPPASVAGRLDCLHGLNDGTQPGLDVIVMPGMAFDTALSRLGHGKGYYDAFLQRYRNALDAGKDDAPLMPLLGT